MQISILRTCNEIAMPYVGKTSIKISSNFMGFVSKFLDGLVHVLPTDDIVIVFPCHLLTKPAFEKTARPHAEM